MPGCLARNDRRAPRERVPGKAIGGTAGRLQLPSLAEGFDALYYMRIADDGSFRDGSFRVEEWADEV